MATYLQKMFGFQERVDLLKDSRPCPRIPTKSVWLSLFAMFAFRIRSFNSLEQELRRARRWESWIGRHKPSADTMGYVLSRFSIDPLRSLVIHVNRTAWRAKTIHVRLGEKYRIVAIDGHELWTSEARCCSECLVREVTRDEKPVLQYYHRVVVAQWVGVTPPPILDVEIVKPGEGEVVAARRLLARILRDYSRLIDVITADALYLEALFVSLVLDAGKHIVVVMKQEAREIYQEADQLKRTFEPQVVQDGARTSRIWDIEGLTSFTGLKRPMRVVWCEESTIRNKRDPGETKARARTRAVVEDKTWIWVTDLPASLVPAVRIQLWGHDRWDLENRGFNELAQHWAMDHCFIHDPTAIQAILLTLALSFLGTYLFYERSLKPGQRRQFTRLTFASRLIEDLACLQGECVWTALKPSG